MDFKNFILILLFFTLFSCTSNNGYSDLDNLYSDFVKTLKDSDSDKLKAYCYRITPDHGTFKYMNENNLSYQRIPDALEERNIKPSYIGAYYYKRTHSFKQELIRKNQLKDLKYIGREVDGVVYVPGLDTYGTQTHILLESRGDTIRYKLGEILRINGTWRAFTLI